MVVGCKEPDIPNPPKALPLHTVVKPPVPFDTNRWKVEAIPSYRSGEVSVRSSMADDLLRVMKPGTKLTELLGLLDQPNRVEALKDARLKDKGFYGDRGYLLLSYPVVVEDRKAFHEDLQFLFDRVGVLLASRRVQIKGAIVLGP